MKPLIFDDPLARILVKAILERITDMPTFDEMGEPVLQSINVEPQDLLSLSRYIGGGIIRNDKKDKTVMLYTFKDGSTKYLGELGGKIDINTIYKNLLEENIKEAKGLVDPRDFRKYVTDRGKWDYKLRQGTIYGLGNSDHTKFIFQGKEMESQDLGNHHFGVLAKATGFFYEKLILVKAGENQMSKPGASKPEWQKYIIHRERVPLEHGGSYNIEYKEWLPPYVDDPRDQYWIIQGFNYFREFNKR